MKIKKEYITYCVLIFALGVITMHALNNINHEKAKSSKYTDMINLEGGEHLEFVYVGSSSCSYSNSVDNHSNVINIKSELKSYASNNDINFIRTGISMDDRPSAGIDYLKKTGPYDEKISGVAWYNTGVIEYILRRTNLKPNTPLVAIMVVDYEVSVNKNYSVKDVERSYTIKEIAKGRDEIAYMNDRAIEELKISNEN